MADRRPFPRWAYARALEEIAAARTEEELEAVGRRCRNLAGDQGQVEVDSAIRRRRIELAIDEGEAVTIFQHRRALERARLEGRREVIEALKAAAAKLEGVARAARSNDKQATAGVCEHDARLLRKVAARFAGGR